MSKWRRQHRTESRDGNEPKIVTALERLGCKVECLPGGGGRPDLLVAISQDERLMAIVEEIADVIDGDLPLTNSTLGRIRDDLLGIANQGRHELMEVKKLSGQRSRTNIATIKAQYPEHLARWGMATCRELKPVQHEGIAAWPGPPVHVVTTPREAAAALGLCLVCGKDITTGMCDEHAEETTT